ncbi:hypothetical protein G6F59_018248 [Rhizopus arrhizus]|nr:hypothetical protein G6F59_018248 [Rhizopus arrhizus]
MDRRQQAGLRARHHHALFEPGLWPAGRCAGEGGGSGLFDGAGQRGHQACGPGRYHQCADRRAKEAADDGPGSVRQAGPERHGARRDVRQRGHLFHSLGHGALDALASGRRQAGAGGVRAGPCDVAAV